MKHELVGGTLNRTDRGITAECTCGWRSSHFSSFAASAAFMDHQERKFEMAEAAAQARSYNDSLR